MKKLLLLLLFPSLVLCQPLTLNDVVWRVPPLVPFNPSQITGIEHWWVAEDIAQSVVTNWPDRIWNLSWVNGDASKRPTNTSNGVVFNSSSQNQMTNIGILDGVTQINVHFFILKVNYFSGFQDILNYGPAEPTPSIGFNSSAKPYVFISPNLWDNGVILSNTWYSLVIVCQPTGNQTVFYTNGVPSNTNTSFHLDRQAWTTLGGGSGNGYFGGTLRELAIWTNVTFTTTQVSNLHYYATNKYGF